MSYRYRITQHIASGAYYVETQISDEGIWTRAYPNGVIAGVDDNCPPFFSMSLEETRDFAVKLKAYHEECRKPTFRVVEEL